MNGPFAAFPFDTTYHGGQLIKNALEKNKRKEKEEACMTLP
jgi:hypothetical protein